MTNQPELVGGTGEGSEPEIKIDVAALGGAEDIASTDFVAETFGKYQLVGELAMGGMAELFLGVHRGLQGVVKVVAIKRVLPQFSESDDFVRMFIGEARLAARLEHRNIVRTYEFGEVNGQYFTAMEYLPGEDLSKVLNKLIVSRQKMPCTMAASLVEQVCAGLHFAHELTDIAGEPLGLVHRDINPANIILTYAGEVKVIDFGVAKTADAEKTQSGTIKGKLAYLSPEQLLARGIDRRSDVFSAGVVLWELLTARPLFIRDSEAATVYAIMNDPIPAVSRYRPDVPLALEKIVERALARTPADRFDTAEEMQTALEAFLDTQEKIDARARVRLLEGLFGTTRAEAKRGIAQTRSLARNVSLVMKLRTDVRHDLADTVGTVANRRQSEPQLEAVVERSPRGLMFALALVIVAGIAAGVLFFLRSKPTQEGTTETNAVTQASLVIESTPPGAAITIEGEPTGMKTPATLHGLAAGKRTVRLELAEFEPKTETVDIPGTGTVTTHIKLSDVLPSRLAVGGLPTGAMIVVDNEPFEAGTVIPMSPGHHEVKIVVDGRTVATKKLEATAGDQRWKLVGDELQPFSPGS